MAICALIVVKRIANPEQRWWRALVVPRRAE
jgi:hypothetical protein